MEDRAPSPPPSVNLERGAGSAVSGSGNVTQTVNVEQPKSGKTTTIVIPIVAAIISAVGGAYATHQFTLFRAAEKTDSQAETLLGIAKSAIELAQSTKADPALVGKLQELASQSQALQANVQLLRSPLGAASLQADFWLPVNKGATLGDSASFGIYRENGPGNISVTFNGGRTSMVAGTPLKYKSKTGKTCTLVYVGPSPDNKLHGFKTPCDA